MDHDMIEADHEGPDARPRGGASTARGRGVGSGAPGGAMMDEATRALVAVSAAIGADDRERLAQELDRAARAAEPGEVEEALLQSYLFVGFPGALNALALWRERTGLEASGGAAGGDASEWRRRGEAVCARVYGAQYGRLRERVAGLHPDLEAWMLEEGYGKVLGRPGLALGVRELCVVGTLVPQDAPAQLRSHLRGALNVGVAVEDVEEALEIACRFAAPARAGTARAVWAQVLERWRIRTAAAGGAEERTGETLTGEAGARSGQGSDRDVR